MTEAVLIDVALALPPLIVGLAITWRLIWPAWKLPGKMRTWPIGWRTSTNTSL